MSTTEMVDVKGQVRRLIAEVLWIDDGQFDETVPLVDYGLDSLRAISLIAALEEQFQVRLDDDVLTRLHNAGQIIRYLAGGRP